MAEHYRNLLLNEWLNIIENSLFNEWLNIIENLLLNEWLNNRNSFFTRCLSIKNTLERMASLYQLPITLGSGFPPTKPKGFLL